MNDHFMPLTRYRWGAAIALLLGAIWIWASVVPPGSTTAGKIPAPQTGFLAPDFTLQTITGEIYALSDFRGQPVILNLWASWCSPCRAEMPAIQHVYDEFQAQGLVILAVNATYQDSASAARDFANEHHLTFPILLDADGEVSKTYHLRALPSTYFIDPEGIIQEVVIGGPMAEALLRTRAEQLFREGR